MKRIFKNLLLAICSVVLVLASMIGFVSCQGIGDKPFEITFKTQPYQYTVGNVVDVYDLVEKEKGVEYSFFMSYLTKSESGETVSSSKTEIKGTTYYFSVASRYTLYVTATRGEKTVENSLEFDVAGSAPVLLVPSTTLVYNVGAKVRVNVLVDRISPIVIPASSSLTVDYYTYQENQSVRLDNTTNTNPKTKTELDAEDTTFRVEFAKEGLYEFHVIAKNDEKAADGVFKVAILPDQTTKIEGISAYKNAEFGAKEDGTVDSSVVRLIGSDDLAKASYVVLEDEFVGGQVARFEFYGRNLPYIGLFNEDDENAIDGNSILVGGKGYTFTMERATVSNQTRLYGCGRMGTKSSPLRTSSNAEEYAFEHWGFTDFEEGKHYFLEIMMKPTGKLVANPTGWGGDFLKGGTYQDMGLYFIVYEVNESVSNPYTVVAYSSARFAKDINSWFEEGEEVKGKLVAYSSISKDITFKYHTDTLLGAEFDKDGIEFDEETKVLNWTAVDGAVNYIVTKGNSDTDRVAILDASQTSLDISDLYEELEYFQVEKFNVYASIGNNTYSGYKYELMISKKAEGMENILVSGDIVEYDLEAKTLDVSLRGGYFNNSSANTEQKNSSDTSRTAMGYVAFDKDYVLDEKGTYVDIYFTGNNMPNVEFFATEINGLFMDDYGYNTDGNGFIVSNGLSAANGSATNTSYRWGYSAYRGYFNYGVSPYTERWTGAEDWNLGAIAPSDGSVSVRDNKNGNDVNLTYSNFSSYSLANLQSTTQNYRYTVGMYKDTAGYVWISSSLYKIDGETETLFATWTSKVSLAGKADAITKHKLETGEVISGKIVIHAAAKGVDSQYAALTNEFTCGMPYEGEEPPALPPSENATFNDDGTVSLKNGGQHTADLTNLTAGYVVLDNNYQLGEYVDIYFTGDNMPWLSFFATEATNTIHNSGSGFVMMNGLGWADSTDNTKYVLSGKASGAAYGYECWVFNPNRTQTKIDSDMFIKRVIGSGKNETERQNLAHALSMYRLSTMPDTKFKMTVGFYENASGYVEMLIDVKKYESDAWVDYYTYTKASTLDAANDADKLGKYLVAYGNQRNAYTTITFSYSEAYTK